MDYELSNDEKIEILSYLIDTFPNKAEIALKEINDICIFRDTEFENKNESYKINNIIKIIFEENILEKDFIKLLIISKYLKNINPEYLIKEIIEEDKYIKNHALFNKNVSKNIEKTIENDLFIIKNKIETILDKSIKADFEIEIILNKSINYLNEILFFNDIIEKKQIINEIKILIDILTKKSIEITDLYQNNILRLKHIEQEQKKITLKQEEEKLIKILDDFNDEFNKIINEQKDIFNDIEAFSLIPVENFLKFPDIINKFSNYLFMIIIINNFILSIESLNIESKYLSNLKKLENELLDNFRLFIEINKKSFEKFTNPNIKDKKILFKNKFFEPIKKSFDDNSAKIINKLMDVLY
ncbi:MAG: hypothetical protein AABZ74_13775 [Cyanobacteriota bacterium]